MDDLIALLLWLTGQPPQTPPQTPTPTTTETTDGTATTMGGGIPIKPAVGDEGGEGDGQ
jgi:hypothetical protein